jgi:hypothetical protein
MPHAEPTLPAVPVSDPAAAALPGDAVEAARLRAIDDTLRPAGTHRTRAIRFLRPERVGDWRLKLYSIAADGELARPELLDASLALAPSIFPAAALGNERHGVGFIIVHDARTASIALYYWWQSFNELHQRIYAGPKSDPRAMTQLANQSAGCVWEIEIIDFERRAWLADVLANPDGPDVARYLGRHHRAEI